MAVDGYQYESHEVIPEHDTRFSLITRYSHSFILLYIYPF